MRTYLISVTGFIVTFIGAAVVVLSCVEAYGLTLGGRHAGAVGYLGGPLPPLWDGAPGPVPRAYDWRGGPVAACARTAPAQGRNRVGESS